MSFKLTIEVPDTKLAATMRLLNGHKVMVENVHASEPKITKKTNGTFHSRAESILTMTGKLPNKGSQLAKAREIFEKLEVRKGIGTVTLGDFRDELEKKKLDRKVGMRCVVEKVVEYL